MDAERFQARAGTDRIVLVQGLLTNLRNLLADISMMMALAQKNPRSGASGFTLIETLVAFAVFAMVVSGVIYGYVQTNRMAEWSAISLAAQSFASQGAEQARAAKWDPWAYPSNTNTDQTPAGSVWTNTGIFDIPIKGNPTNGNFGFFETDIVSVVTVTLNPPLRKIVSTTYWNFYLTGTAYSNTVVLLRAPDQ
jgi:type II secretory pathway pseudopilin PulG